MQCINPSWDIAPCHRVMFEIGIYTGSRISDILIVTAIKVNSLLRIKGERMSLQFSYFVKPQNTNPTTMFTNYTAHLSPCLGCPPLCIFLFFDTELKAHELLLSCVRCVVVHARLRTLARKFSQIARMSLRLFAAPFQFRNFPLLPFAGW